MATSKPSRAASVAAAAPIPRLAPVIRTTGDVFAIQPPKMSVLFSHYDALHGRAQPGFRGRRDEWPAVCTRTLRKQQFSACVEHQLGQQHNQYDMNEDTDVNSL